MNYAALLARMKGLRALVVGDVMLDEYIVGRATRISPEAPVMVVRRERSFHVPGGAANVAKNILALGGSAHLVGACGDDAAGRSLIEALALSGVDASGVVAHSDRPTTCKTRVMADHAHQVLRIDTEQDDPISDEAADALVSHFESVLPEADVIVLSDYLKGTLTSQLVSRILETSQKAGRPVCVNPKPASLDQYQHASLVTLNRSEASTAAGMAIDGVAAAQSAASALRSSLDVEAIVVTLGEEGMVAETSVEGLHIAAPKVEVYDTAGAGDTVIATLALGWAAVGADPTVFGLAALTSSAVVRKVGVAVPSATDLEEIRSLG